MTSSKRPVSYRVGGSETHLADAEAADGMSFFLPAAVDTRQIWCCRLVLHLMSLRTTANKHYILYSPNTGTIKHDRVRSRAQPFAV